MPPSTQREQATRLLAQHGMLRLTELTSAGITAATVSRMERDGSIIRLSRGLYQLADAAIETHHSLAEAAKRLPKGVICLTSALAFHELTDQLPRRIWMAVGKKDWVPRDAERTIRIARFADTLLDNGVETHLVEHVPVRIFNVPKTIADCFRHRRSVGLNVAIEGLEQALRHRKARPADIAEEASRGGVWTVMRPYLEAFTANG
jgi:predicted transcriptional regulator of viral defense system